MSQQPPTCAHCKGPATGLSGGVWCCRTCFWSREPGTLRGVFAALFVCAALVAVGCVGRRRVEPDTSATVTAFRDHRALYAQACREIAQKAAGGDYADDRAFLEDHNARSAACRDGAFQQHADRIQEELGDGKWSNEATADLFTRIADELEASR